MIGGRMAGIWLAYQLLPPQYAAMIAIGNDITFKNFNEKIIKGVHRVLPKSMDISRASDVHVESHFIFLLIRKVYFLISIKGVRI